MFYYFLKQITRSYPTPKNQAMNVYKLHYGYTDTYNSLRESKEWGNISLLPLYSNDQNERGGGDVRAIGKAETKTFWRSTCSLEKNIVT
jgi:hypothetical protein